MGGELWRSNVIMTSTLLPGVVFCIFFVMNLVRRNVKWGHGTVDRLLALLICFALLPPFQLLWGEGSSAAVPFGTLVALMMLWFFISVPLV